MRSLRLEPTKFITIIIDGMDLCFLAVFISCKMHTTTNNNNYRIEFLGEPGIDDGGLRLEF